MKIQWLAEFNPSNFHSLEDVRNDLFKYKRFVQVC